MKKIAFTLPTIVWLFFPIFFGISRVYAATSNQTQNNPQNPQVESQNIFNIPLVLYTGPPPVTPPPNPPKILICSSSSTGIPDNDPVGVTNSISINDLRYIYDLEVRLDISHTWVGDLIVGLNHVDTGTSIMLIKRPSPSGDENYCGENNIQAILDDEISLPAKRECASSPAAISGIFFPADPLGNFDMEPVSGEWVLSVSDNDSGDTGAINLWCLTATLTDSPIPPEPPPSPPDVPDSALINGVTGKGQALPLDCESRSAVDWANYFGKYIDELAFFNQLQSSDNPDAGFVGNVYGQWGQIPPNDYGVHAEPIASLLRDFGLPAQANRPMTWDQLRGEIAAGRPVITWIIGTYSASALANAVPEYYLPSDGSISIVAKYEHTVVATGYSPSTVTFLNGAGIYTISREKFLESWSALGNMGITYQP